MCKIPSRHESLIGRNCVRVNMLINRRVLSSLDALPMTHKMLMTVSSTDDVLTNSETNATRALR